MIKILSLIKRKKPPLATKSLHRKVQNKHKQAISLLIDIIFNQGDVTVVSVLKLAKLDNVKEKKNWLSAGAGISDYFFVQCKDKAICLMCQDSVAVFKEYNLTTIHYDSQHKE